MTLDQLWQHLFDARTSEERRQWARRIAITDEREDELRKTVRDPVADILEAYAEHCSDSDGDRYLAAGMFRAAAILRELYVCPMRGDSLGDVFRTVYTLLDGKRVTVTTDSNGEPGTRIEEP